MKAILNTALKLELNSYFRGTLYELQAVLLDFIRNGHVYDKRLGICSNLSLGKLVYYMTGTSTPIKGRPWETNHDVYHNTAKWDSDGAKYKGSQMKQRKKLAVKLLKSIQQFLAESNREN